MADIHRIPNEPTEADLTRSMVRLTREMLAMSALLMGALEAGKDHFPPEAQPIVTDLSRTFSKMKADTEAALLKVAA